MGSISIKGADILHVGDRVLIERAQTAGPGQVNLSPTRVFELGNYQSLSTIFDIPDLTFSVESWDASAALEAMLTGTTLGALADGTQIDLGKAAPIDIASEFKGGKLAADPFATVASISCPYLQLESVSYKYGIRDQAAQTVGLRGDSIYYGPGSVYQEETAGTNAANQVINLAHTAYPYAGDLTDGTKYVLGVKVRDANGVRRLRFGTDYTEAATGAGTAKTVAVTIISPVATTGFIDVIYASDVVAEYPQASHTVVSTTRPAAIRGRDIEIYIGGELITNRWTSVQAFTADWKVALDRDEEFGNYHLVNQDYTTPPDVTGTIQIKPRDPAEFYAKVAQAAGVGSGVVGPNAAPPTELLVKLKSPVDASVLKCLYVPDARINVPGYSAQVNQKLMPTLNYQSDAGLLYVVKGNKV